MGGDSVRVWEGLKTTRIHGRLERMSECIWCWKHVYVPSFWDSPRHDCLRTHRARQRNHPSYPWRFDSDAGSLPDKPHKILLLQLTRTLSAMRNRQKRGWCRLIPLSSVLSALVLLRCSSCITIIFKNEDEVVVAVERTVNTCSSYNIFDPYGSAGKSFPFKNLFSPKGDVLCATHFFRGEACRSIISLKYMRRWGDSATPTNK